MGRMKTEQSQWAHRKQRQDEALIHQGAPLNPAAAHNFIGQPHALADKCVCNGLRIAATQ